MPQHHLHIVAFAIPYPPNYGGIIDVYYKLKSLHALGISIHLHCFEYDRPRAEELNKYCATIHYYPRNTGIKSALSIKPYIVTSRNHPELLQNLLHDDYPILFEGLHTCGFLHHPALKDRLKIYRESNIEHHYYYHLFKSEKKLLKKIYFLSESIKLRLYQNTLRHASMMLVVSEADEKYLHKIFPQSTVHYLPSFHPGEEITSKQGQGDYALYHGNLMVAENLHAVTWLIKEIFAYNNTPFRIAGLNPPEELTALIEQYPHITLHPNLSDAEMHKMIQDAHVNILVTFQATGLKLKLLNTLYNGRYTLVNHAMLNGTGLDTLCHTGDDAASLSDTLNQLFKQPFDARQLEQRKKLLDERYSNSRNAMKLYRYLFT